MNPDLFKSNILNGKKSSLQCLAIGCNSQTPVVLHLLTNAVVCDFFFPIVVWKGFLRELQCRYSSIFILEFVVWVFFLSTTPLSQMYSHKWPGLVHSMKKLLILLFLSVSWSLQVSSHPSAWCYFSVREKRNCCPAVAAMQCWASFWSVLELFLMHRGSA